MILRVLRPDRLQLKMIELINSVMGVNFFSEDQMELSTIVQNECHGRVPLLLCSAPGFDPSFKVEMLAKEKGTRL